MIFARVQPHHGLCNIINQQIDFTRRISSDLILISDGNFNWVGTHIHAVLKIVTGLLVVPNYRGIR